MAMDFETAWFVYDDDRLLYEGDGDYSDTFDQAYKNGEEADCDMFVIFELMGGGNTKRVRAIWASLKSD